MSSPMQTLSGIPPANVGRMVQDFIDNGASRVIVELNEDGTFTVSAA